MDETNTRYVVGLGNPGRTYEGTRHNLGFRVVEALVRRWNVGPPRRAFSGLLWDARYGPYRVMLLAPQTFMNRSGQAVSELARFYKAQPRDMLIAMDDMDLPPGAIRLRPEGSDGGHNGLADVILALGTTQVPRLRLGIGSPPPRMDGADYVLGQLTEDERAAANQAIDEACQAVEDWLNLGIEAAMNRHN